MGTDTPMVQPNIRCITDVDSRVLVVCVDVEVDMRNGLVWQIAACTKYPNVGFNSFIRRDLTPVMNGLSQSMESRAVAMKHYFYSAESERYVANDFARWIEDIKHQTSNIKHQTSNIKHQTSSCPKAGARRPSVAQRFCP
jgi:hypothetical protein